ncbi:MAG: TonB-dependent receptor plug domain-containing protein, partial [Telluria sp.]
MFQTTTLRRSVLLALYGSVALAAFSPSAFAQSEAPQVQSNDVLPSVSIVGSRRVTAASATETAVPVDFIPMTKIAEQGGQFDLAQTLTFISPSFNSTRQTGADGADLVDSAALRGLGSDQTLVLMNGKRRHSTSLVNIFGARNRGNTGT